MSLWLLFYGFLGLLGLYALVDHYVLQPRRDRAEYGAEWARYDATAFHPKTIPAAPGARTRVHRVGVEMVSTGGKRAVRIRSKGGIAVHEIRADGRFSSHGLYYVKLRPFIWGWTGRLHLVEVEQGTIPASNPGGGVVYEKGVQIIEWDTTHHPPVPLRDYAAYERKKQRLTVAAQELPARAVGARGTAWEATLKDPFGRYTWIPVLGSSLAFGVLMQGGWSGSWHGVSPGGWVFLGILALLSGGLPGLLVGGLLLPAIARRLLATVHPEARQAWNVVRAEERQASAKEALRRLRETPRPGMG